MSQVIEVLCQVLITYRCIRITKCNESVILTMDQDEIFFSITCVTGCLSSMGIPHFTVLHIIVLHRYCVFHKLKVCGHPHEKVY